MVQYGLIILGNSGVGKSFLANCLLGENRFQHGINPEAVTTKTEYVEVTFQEDTYAVFNIPGLIEPDQERIDLNKQEIEKAFKHRPNSIIIYVFGHQNGRIRNEDVIAFNALHESYDFKQGSFIIVFNNLSTRRPTDYEGKTMVLLKRLLKVDFSEANICFLTEVDANNNEVIETLRQELIKVILNHEPQEYRKIRDIDLTIDMVNRFKKQIDERKKQFNENEMSIRDEIQHNQAKIQRSMAIKQSLMESRQLLQKKLNKKRKLGSRNTSESSSAVDQNRSENPSSSSAANSNMSRCVIKYQSEQNPRDDKSMPRMDPSHRSSSKPEVHVKLSCPIL